MTNQRVSKQNSAWHAPLLVVQSDPGAQDALMAFLSAVPPLSGWIILVFGVDDLPSAGAMTGQEMHLWEPDQPLLPNQVTLVPSDAQIALVDNNLTIDSQALQADPATGGAARFLRTMNKAQLGQCCAIQFSENDHTGPVSDLRKLGVPVFAPPGLVPAQGAVGVTVRLPDQMPASITHRLTDGASPGDGVAALRRILARIESRYRVDFTVFAPAITRMRIGRRMARLGISGFPNYEQRLLDDPAEVGHLFTEMLNGNTGFHRDPDAFAALRHHAIDRLAHSDPHTERPLRIWVPACASGEEAYSIAIEMAEALERFDRPRAMRIIASDLNPAAVERAARGAFAPDQIQGLPEHLRAKYFRFHDGAYHVVDTLRHKIVFAVHDVLNDPPYLGVDLVSCRNLLIYLTAKARARALSMLSFGLRPSGVLFLGPSEGPAPFDAEFDPLDPVWRLYIKKDATPQTTAPAATATLTAPPLAQPPDTESPEVCAAQRLAVYRAALQRLAPSAVLLSAAGEVLDSFGAATLVARPPDEEGDRSIDALVHRDLHAPFYAALRQMRQAPLGPAPFVTGLDLGDGMPRMLRFTCDAIHGAGAEFLLLHMGFSRSDATDPDGGTGEMAQMSARVAALERELAQTRRALQDVSQRHEQSGRVMQASQSELHASNRSLLSNNAELSQDNARYVQRLLSLARRHQRVEDVLESLHVGMVELSADFTLRRISDLTASRLGVTQSVIGAPLVALGLGADFAALPSRLRAVLERGEPDQIEGVQDGALLEIRLFRGRDGTAVLLFNWS